MMTIANYLSTQIKGWHKREPPEESLIQVIKVGGEIDDPREPLNMIENSAAKNSDFVLILGFLSTKFA